MTTQGQGPTVPGAAVAAGEAVLGEHRRTIGDGDTKSTDDGVPVGAADAEADAVRSGASGEDDTLTDPGNAARPEFAGPGGGTDASATDDGVPVGEADVEADRRRTGADDEGS